MVMIGAALTLDMSRTTTNATSSTKIMECDVVAGSRPNTQYLLVDPVNIELPPTYSIDITSVVEVDSEKASPGSRAVFPLGVPQTTHSSVALGVRPADAVVEINPSAGGKDDVLSGRGPLISTSSIQSLSCLDQLDSRHRLRRVSTR